MHTLLSLLLCCQIILSSCMSTVFMSQFNFLLPAEASEVPVQQSEESKESSAQGDAAVSITAPSAILMEASTGTIIYEKNSHEIRHPASITKIMTLNLIFDALEQGKFNLNDTVTVSEHASGMGGSQVFLEAGETQDVETMIKCISIASANDASVAMAEFVSGSEEAFVSEMNEKAKSLGMKDTHFVNCCGLDVENHMTSAYDVALMSRELTVKHPQIHDYCTIWMDSFVHNTARGSKEFGLANTNKLIRQYEYATGLKTGSTGLAKFCLSATAEKDGMELIAVIMGADNPKNRFSDAAALLNYGFSKCRIFTDDPSEGNTTIPVKRGVEHSLSLSPANQFQYLSVKGEDFSAITKDLSLPEYIEAPVKKGEKVGEIIYTLGGEKIGAVDIIAKQDMEKADFSHYVLDVFLAYFS